MPCGPAKARRAFTVAHVTASADDTAAVTAEGSSSGDWRGAAAETAAAPPMTNRL